MRDISAALLSASALVMISLPTAATQPAAASRFEVADLGEAAGIVIDGQLEGAWTGAPMADEFQEYRPREGAPASVRTEVRFARDANYFYVAARMFDPDISRLRTGLARRDSFSNEQDWFSIAIDPIGSQRVSQLFYFNPEGVIWDGLTNDDAGTSNPAADFEVDVATQVTPDSWIVELRIPFTELRYSSRTPEAWHVLLRRNYPRDERHQMAAPAIPKNAPCFICLAAPLHPPGELPAPRSLSFVPEVVGLGRGEGPGSDDLDWHSKLEPSLEVKLRASPSTVFDGTINPDFSQVELDTPQLSSNQQFAVAFPEKRPFFLEGVDILDSPLRAIYTRSVTNPDWGARGTHRGIWDGVLLSARDDGGGVTVLPGPLTTGFQAQHFSSLATIGRVRMPRGAVAIGALLTDRRTDGAYNTVAGPDISWRLSPTTRVNVQWLTSRTRGDGEFPGIGDLPVASGDAASIDLLHESRHWRGTLLLRELDENFGADNGFIPQVGIRQVATELRYRFVDLPIVSELAPYVTTDDREDFNGATVSAAPRLGVQATLPRNTVLIGEWRPEEQVRVRADSEPRSLSQGYVSLTTNPGARFPALSLSATFGEAVDFTIDRVGRGETLAGSVLWRPLARFELEPRFDFTTVRTEQSGASPAQTARESAAQVFATLHLTTRDRFRLILQRIQVEREESSSGPRLIDRNQFVGSLLFTHERSLTRRVHVGVSFAHASTELDPVAQDTVEFFLKVQSGMSKATGVRW